MYLEEIIGDVQLEDSTVECMKGAFHAFATTGTQAPETAKILKENVEFIKENMACYNSF